MEDRKAYVRRKTLEYEKLRQGAEDDEWAREKRRQLENSRFAKVAVGNVAGQIGAGVGIARGVYHDAKAIKDGAVFTYNLANPHASGHEEAVATGRSIVKGGADYVASRTANPSLVQGDLEHLGSQMNRDLNPYAGPAAPTLAGEIARRFNVGMNQGETAYNVGSVMLPVYGQAKGALTLGRLASPGPAKYIKMGATPGQAARFALPYKGLGHHAYIPRGATWAKVPGVENIANRLGVPPEKLNGKVPKSIVDSRFNVVKPRVETGQFYQRHVGIDKDYYGGKVGRNFGGENWSAKNFGWGKYDPVARLWLGMPSANKKILGGAASLDATGRATATDKRKR